jgi:ribose transport system substrate-binding protein
MTGLMSFDVKRLALLAAPGSPWRVDRRCRRRGSVRPRPQGGIRRAAPRRALAVDLRRGDRQFVVAEGDASAPYVTNIRKPSKPLTFAFAEGWAAIPFSVSINQGIYRIAEEQGISIIYCDQEFKPEKAVTCAEQLSQQKPDFAIVSNWQSGAAEAIMKIYDAAKIPVVNIDVWHPNGIFLGADNYVSGQIGGKAAGEYAKSLGKCGEVTIFNGINPGEGDAAAQRMAGFTDGVQEVCGAVPADRIAEDLRRRHDRAGADQDDRLADGASRGRLRARHLDRRRPPAGISKALSQNARDSAAVGLGCDEIGVAETKAGHPGTTKFLGCVAYFPEKYPDYAMSIGLDVVEGKPVPNEVHSEHVFLDKDSIASVYP